MYRNINKKIFHVIMIIVIVFVILSIAGILVLRYQVEGEYNMPFKITKISIVESTEGQEYMVNQNNDIYIYIEKNSSYGKTEIIDNVEIKNIIINKQVEKGETKLYKPVADGKRMFINSPENEITEITYKGELLPNIKEQKITNQAGIVAFRYAINNLAQYEVKMGETVEHDKLLKLTNIKQEELQTNLKFDLIINLVSGKKYQANIELNTPTEEIFEEGKVGIEITDLENIIFKRIEN